MEQEIWLPIKYGNGKKEISNCGNVRNAITGRLLKSHISKQNGYSLISFWVDGANKTFKIHRLVAEHFMPNPENRKTVNHKDLNKSNNSVDNLEWNTIKENVDHYFKNGFKGKISDNDVLYIRENIERIGFVKLASEFGVNELYILSIANGTCKSKIHSHLIRDKRPSAPRVVKKFCLNGDLVETYKSIGDAAKHNDTRIGVIQRVASGERKTFRGFIYKIDGYTQVKRDDKGMSRLARWKEKQKINRLGFDLSLVLKQGLAK